MGSLGDGKGEQAGFGKKRTLFTPKKCFFQKKNSRKAHLL